ncbi:hypothetical protein S40288_01905 [Stachybotrys chartarum IBT 40288]|nr:hypothetical protein S40288_01905 [Stachybotrys chartarum IBT 40288]
MERLPYLRPAPEPNQLYSKLHNDHIRLFTLYPGTWDDELRGDIFEASLSFDYVAVSYAWGSPRAIRQIHTNGFIKGITFNLDLVLRSIRSSSATTTIWVDSLCINQDNVDEKSAQVEFMHRIFANARMVLAYVGEGIPRSDPNYHGHLNRLGRAQPCSYSQSPEEAWEFIDRDMARLSSSTTNISASDRHRCMLSLLVALSDPILTQRLRSHEIFTTASPFTDRQLHCLFEWLRAFFVLPWWDRMWITQEVGVGKGLMLVYGRTTLSFDVLTAAVSNISSSSQDIALITHRADVKVLQLLVKKVTTIADLRRLHAAGFRPNLTDPSYRFRSLDSPMLWLLRTFRHRHSSDPRDKIFALSQLLREVKKALPYIIHTEYQVTIPELYSNVVFALMRETGIFWVTSRDLTGKWRDKLPSWVPNWADAMFSPDPDSVAWRVRTCFNCSNVTLRCMDLRGNIVGLQPSQYFTQASQGVLRNNESKVVPSTEEYYNEFGGGRKFMKTFSSDTSPITLEQHDPDLQKLTKTEMRMTLFSYKLDEVTCVFPPVEPDLQNLGGVFTNYVSQTYDHTSDSASHWFQTAGVEFAKACCFGVKPGKGEDVLRIEIEDHADILLWLLAFIEDDLMFGGEAPALPSPSLPYNFSQNFRHNLLGYIPYSLFLLLPRDSRFYDEARSQGSANHRHQTQGMLPWQEIRANNKHTIGQIHKMMQQTAPGQCLYLTLAGFVGMGPPQTAVKDEVHIIDTGLCPYVLRPDYDPGLAFGRCPVYRVVGDCYVRHMPRWDPMKLEQISLV